MNARDTTFLYIVEFPGKIVPDRGELDEQEAKQLFDRHGVKLSLTTASNLKANGKVKRRHGPIVKVIVRRAIRELAVTSTI